MIKEKAININIVGRNLNKYRNLGYKCNVGEWICKDMIMVDDVYKACEEQLNKFFYKR